MSKQLLMNQYEMIEKTIEHNFSAIKSLLEQAKALSELSDSMAWENWNPETKAALDKTVLEMLNSVDSLVDNTRNLLARLREFASEVIK